MLLVIDIGNTNTVVGVYHGDALEAHWRIQTAHGRTSDELRILIRGLLEDDGLELGDVQGICISSVVPPLNDAFISVARETFRVEPIMVEPGVKTGVKLHNENPKELGADRLVNCVGALEERDGPLIVVDFGTATTFDFVTKDREYKGGIIVPGIQLAADALFERCAKLPRVEIAIPDRVIGRDTVTNIRSGLTYGYADLVDGLIRRMREEAEADATVVATGGLAPVIAEAAHGIDVVDPYLTLKGLRAIHERNAKVAT